jgi:GAF domain-containing protein
VERISNEKAYGEFRAILHREGVRPALIFLNGLTSHRFSAIYQFEHETLRNLYFYDRENPEIESIEEIPVTASYCVFLRETGVLFHTSDALRDERVRTHPKREKVLAYCGVPLLDAKGALFGSICHFDLRPRVIADSDVELMESVALLLREERAVSRDSSNAKP